MDRACDMSLGRFLWVLSSKIPIKIVSDHPYVNREMAGSSQEYNV